MVLKLRFLIGHLRAILPPSSPSSATVHAKLSCYSDAPCDLDFPSCRFESYPDTMGALVLLPQFDMGRWLDSSSLSATTLVVGRGTTASESG
ncbi:hypothetical protein Droror1_Dr00019318 [Drosera rotundifolia]